MRFTLFLLFTFAPFAALVAEETDDIHYLPKYDVTADVMAAMIPCDQVRDIGDDAKARCHSFDLSTITLVKAPASRFPKPVRCFVRAADGHVIQEITKEGFMYPADSHWPAGFLSSNQPAEYSAFYFMLRPHLSSSRITLGDVDQLLTEYTAFSEKRLSAAIRHYGAMGGAFFELSWAMVPDEIAFIATSPAAAAAIGQRLGVAAHQKIVRVSIEKWAELKAQRGVAFPVADGATEIDCITPWRSTTGLPLVLDHAALLRIGWVQYQKQPTETPRRDIIVVGMYSAPSDYVTEK